MRNDHKSLKTYIYTTTANTDMDGYETSEQNPLERMLVRYHHQLEELLNGGKYSD
jgi:hypothetical protein